MTDLCHIAIHLLICYLLVLIALVLLLFCSSCNPIISGGCLSLLSSTFVRKAPIHSLVLLTHYGIIHLICLVSWIGSSVVDHVGTATTSIIP